MAKRRPGSTLTHDNWDDEEDVPEGTSSTTGLFSGFAGLAQQQPPAVKPGSFSFGLTGDEPKSLSQPTSTQPFTFGKTAPGPAEVAVKSKSEESSTTGVNQPVATAGLSAEVKEQKEQKMGPKRTRVEQNGDSHIESYEPVNAAVLKDNKVFLKDLKDLNEGVFGVITDFMNVNPRIDLRPTFRDYFTHFSAILARANQSSTSSLSVRSPGCVFGASSAEIDKSQISLKDPVPEKPKEPAWAYTPATTTVKRSTLSKSEFGFNFAPSSSLSSSITSVAHSTMSDTIMSMGQPSSTHSGRPLIMSGLVPPKMKEDEAKKPLFTFGAAAAAVKPTGVTGTKPSDGSKTESSTPTAASTEPKKPPAFPGFSFGTSTPPQTGSAFPSLGATPPFFGFSPASVTKPDAGTAGASASAQGENEDEADKPPVVEIVDIEEEGSVFSKRCKLFFMKDGSFTEKGLGTLHLKKTTTDDGETKKQLLVRAGTTLGNILLNIALSADMPFERAGKNNVRFACIPNPPINPKAPKEEQEKPVTMLVRVKTSADADEVIDEIKKFVN